MMKIRNVVSKEMYVGEALKNGYQGIVVSGEGGFAPIRGMNVPREAHLTETSSNVTLVAFKSPEYGPVVVCPSERSAAYRRFATPDHGKPYKDFYYNVSAQAFNLLKYYYLASRVVMTHLCGGGRRFDENPTIAACSIEAWRHTYGEEGELAFVGCCIGPHTIDIARRMIEKEATPGTPRQIGVTWRMKPFGEILELDWSGAAGGQPF